MTRTHQNFPNPKNETKTKSDDKTKNRKRNKRDETKYNKYEKDKKRINQFQKKWQEISPKYIIKFTYNRRTKTFMSLQTRDIMNKEVVDKIILCLNMHSPQERTNNPYVQRGPKNLRRGMDGIMININTFSKYSIKRHKFLTNQDWLKFDQNYDETNIQGKINNQTDIKGEFDKLKIENEEILRKFEILQKENAELKERMNKEIISKSNFQDMLNQTKDQIIENINNETHKFINSEIGKIQTNMERKQAENALLVNSKLKSLEINDIQREKQMIELKIGNLERDKLMEQNQLKTNLQAKQICYDELNKFHEFIEQTLKLEENKVNQKTNQFNELIIKYTQQGINEIESQIHQLAINSDQKNENIQMLRNALITLAQNQVQQEAKIEYNKQEYQTELSKCEYVLGATAKQQKLMKIQLDSMGNFIQSQEQRPITQITDSTSTMMIEDLN